MSFSLDLDLFEPETASSEGASATLLELELHQVVMNPNQPRRTFSKEELQELASSIQAVGVIHPPTVRPLPDGKTFELISGERRFRAASLAGLKKMPFIVRQVNATLSAQAALIENVQRVDLNPLEIALAMKQLMTKLNLTQDELAVRVSKKRSTVANYLRLLTLPKSIQESIERQQISMGHAKALLSLQTEEKQMLLFQRILHEDLSVRQAEEAAQTATAKPKQPPSYSNRDFYLEHLAEKIQQKLGTKVTIQSKGSGGRVYIDYYNLEDLDRLLEIFQVEG